MANDVLISAELVPRTPNLTALLHRRAVFGFGALLLLTIPAFWFSYFFPPKVESALRVHVHGIAMFLWLILLMTQATLIRNASRPLHRAIGKASYVLFPVIFVSTLSVQHLRLNQKIDAEQLYFLYVVLSLLSVFALSYALGMWNRKKPALHARYMVCTALALVDPIAGRVVFFHFGIEPPQMQVATYALVDAILIWLAYADWRSGNGIRVFPAMLAVFVAAQIPTFIFFRMPWWPRFAEWYAALPLF